MIKLRSRKLFKSSSKSGRERRGGEGEGGGCGGAGIIEWEMRPGGMLVQKRESSCKGEGVIKVRVSTGLQWHEISIGATSTFGQLKMVLSLVTGLEPREQRLLFRGKERDDDEHLHMVGVNNADKVLLLEDPAIKERKLRAMMVNQALGSPRHTVIKV